MKKTQLTWLDRLMVDVTFAEAGFDAAVLFGTNGNRHHRSELSREQEKFFGPARDRSIPAHS